MELLGYYNYWVFAVLLMIGFYAETDDPTLRLDEEEIAEARWVTPAEVLEPDGFFIPSSISLAHFLIRSWAEGASR